jgi:hypothetical protein
MEKFKDDRGEDARRAGLRRPLGGVMAVAVALAIGTAPAAAAPARVRPYALLDIPVGITLEQLQQRGHPDAARLPDVRLICSGDPDALGLVSLDLSDLLQKIGALRCGFFVPGPANQQGAPFRAASFQVFNEESDPVFLFFRPNEVDEYRLAQISLAMPNARYREIVALFNRAYGSPVNFDVIGVPTAYGGDFPNIRYNWDNGVSSINLSLYSMVLNTMSVLFVDNDLWAKAGREMDEIERVGR